MYFVCSVGPMIGGWIQSLGTLRFVKMFVTHFFRCGVSGVKHLLRMAQKFHPASPVFAAAFCCAIGVTVTSGATAARKSYNVPGGDAAATLTQFTRHSGCQIVYLVENVRDEKTQPVRGEYAALDALRVMLSGTALFAVQDESTGALVVSRKRPAPAQKEQEESERSRGPPAANPPAPPPDTPKTNQPKHNESHPVKPRTLLTFLTGLLAGVTAVDAQTSGTIEGRILNPRSGTVVEGARVSVENTSAVTFSDADGQYRLNQVPSGTVRLRIFFTGSTPQTEEVAVAAGQTAHRDISLVLGKATTGRKTDDQIIKLDKFAVNESREMDASAIAINEQRFAHNMKTVVSTDEFGPITEGNVAEFLRYLPGMTVDVSGGDHRTVGIDGAPPGNTPITLGGINLPSAPLNSTSRVVEAGFFNLNNISRLEVNLSPTPDSQGTALAGSINMVPRSSFERSKPVFNGSVYLLARDDQLTLSKGPNLYREPRRVTHPGMEFSWVVPVNRRFGFSVSAGSSTQYIMQDGVNQTWRGITVGTDGSAFPHTTPDRPYLSSYMFSNAPTESSRNSAAITLDFKLSSYDRISFSYQYSGWDQWGARKNFQFNPNRIVPGGFGPTFTQGVAGAGNIIITAANGGVRYFRSQMPTFSWRHEGPIWKMDAGAGRAHGLGGFRSADKGMFLSVEARRNAVTVNFDQVGAMRPGVITVVDAATGASVDPYRLDSYPLTTVTDNPRRNEDVNFTAFWNVRRDFTWVVPVSLKSGLDFRQSARDITSTTYSYTYRGADGLGNTRPGTAALVLDPYVSQRTNPFGFPAMQLPDYKGAFDYFKANPSYFALDENNAYRGWVGASKRSVEGISATYLRADVSLLKGRLLLVGGVRLEQTNIEAEGPLTDPTRNNQRDASGRPLRTSTGATIPITTNALETSKLTFLGRQAHAEKEYLRYFPSLNVSFNVRENLIARAAVSTSIGRPDFNQYAGGVTLPDTDLGPIPGRRISLNNPGIKPWSAVSTRARLEYYFAGVGQITVGAYRRDYTNFFASTFFMPTDEFLAQWGLDPDVYGAYEVATQYNLTNVIRTEGFDASYKQALTFLPQWARGVQVFANISTRHTIGSSLKALGFREIPRSGSWGVSLTRPRFDVRLNCSFRADQPIRDNTGASIAPGTVYSTLGRNTIDVVAEYTFWKNLAVFTNLRNITDVPNRNGVRTNSGVWLGEYERYGSLWSLGIKGTY